MARPSDRSLTDLADLCGLLSDPTRLRLVLLLAVAERNVMSLGKELKASQPTVSHHLGLLRMNRLIVGKRKGKEVIYSLAPNVRVSGGKVKISLPPYSVTVEGC